LTDVSFLSLYRSPPRRWQFASRGVVSRQKRERPKSARSPVPLGFMECEMGSEEVLINPEMVRVCRVAGVAAWGVQRMRPTIMGARSLSCEDVKKK
jgi:hypothetical protein